MDIIISVINSTLKKLKRKVNLLYIYRDGRIAWKIFVNVHLTARNIEKRIL